ncbi:MAG: hypothetical protein PHC75_03020 [Burkholderiales bacterium]|nr:hypothetical protein [Burkholderiales bacterium]
MINEFAIKAINLLLDANPNTKPMLQKYSTKIVQLDLPFIAIAFIISPDGSLSPEKSTPDCVIKIPIASASHLIHNDEVKTYKTLEITGDKTLAKDLLSILATIETTKLLYLHQNPFLSMFANKLEQIIDNLVSYAKLVANNASLSTSQYIQYETSSIANKHEVNQFCKQVDEVSSQTELLAKKVEKINALN